MSIEKHTLTISTTGSAGSASGSGILSLPLCELVAIHLDYHADAPATTDVTVTATGDPASVTLLTRTSSVTDGWFYPGVNVHDNTAAAVTGAYAPPVIHNGALTIAVAQADALTGCVVATVLVRV